MRCKTSSLLKLLVCLIALVSSKTHATQEVRILEGEIRRTLHTPYLLFLPAKYNEEIHRQWPLIVYLHGGSLRGDDVERVRTLGLPQRIENDPEFPAIVVSPLCPAGEIWADADALSAVIDQVQRFRRVDAKRIYLTGHSMGGRGALYFAARTPNRFAGVVAISPVSPVSDWVERLRDVPLWIIHGANDSIARIAETEEFVHAIENAGGHPRFTALPDRDHFILDLYDGGEVFDWLFRQKREERDAH